MAEPIADLWGAEFPEIQEEPAPVTMLKQQAEFLRRRTAGRIAGEVRQTTEEGTVWCSLYAKVTHPQEYSFRLVSCAYPIDEDPLNPHRLTAFNIPADTQEALEDKTAFLAWLGAALSSPEIHRVIVNLMRNTDDRAAS